MYRLVKIGIYIYPVESNGYKYAIAQAVGQAVQAGQKVDKSTPIELILVD